jgi:hypothetical protein
MSKPNVIFINLENSDDAHNLGLLIGKIIDSLGDAGVLSGNVTSYGGLNIDDPSVVAKLEDLQGIFEDKLESQDDRVQDIEVRQKWAEGNVIHADFGGDDNVMRDLPELVPPSDSTH